ncbi:hypothetical protein RchiOBHm_Chr1g0354361 [Rosa chinensis]|uniref:Uncharacterized protein n=1 Tax=Rosa chinensis TaxID=74649 RepID=A0A2P6SH42_ROSCH|nr:hypothetical protein RchiOBHm_Chr1g0354361 [Rosa chinensis]
MDCIEVYRPFHLMFDTSSKKNGNRAIWINHLDKLLDLVVQQKRLILSDRNLFPSLLASLLSPSFQSL